MPPKTKYEAPLPGGGIECDTLWAVIIRSPQALQLASKIEPEGIAKPECGKLPVAAESPRKAGKRPHLRRTNAGVQRTKPVKVKPSRTLWTAFSSPKAKR